MNNFFKKVENKQLIISWLRLKIILIDKMYSEE
jgi:hypothetical protein